MVGLRQGIAGEGSKGSTYFFDDLSLIQHSLVVETNGVCFFRNSNKL